MEWCGEGLTQLYLPSGRKVPIPGSAARRAVLVAAVRAGVRRWRPGGLEGVAAPLLGGIGGWAGWGRRGERVRGIGGALWLVWL